MRPIHLKEDQELEALRQEEQALLQREREFAENRRRLDEERMERERTMPPFDVIQEREKLKRHEQIVSRGEVKNELRAQNRSLLLFVLLAIAAGTLIWWAFKLMK